MLSVDEIQAALAAGNLSETSRDTGLAYDTVWRVRHGKTARVSYTTLKTLSDYVQAKQQEDGDDE